MEPVNPECKMRFRHKSAYLLVLLFIMGGSISACAAKEKTRPDHNENPSSSPFYFVQITDTHLGDRDHFERTRKLVADINRLPMKIEFVVHTGDIVADRIHNQQVVSKTLNVLKKLRAPLYFIPGNHDILADNIDNTVKAYQENFGKLVRQIKVRGVTFFFIYTEPLARSVMVPGFDPLERLRILLQQGKGSPVIVCHHRPSVEDFYRNTMHRGWPEKKRRRWIRLLNEYNVKAVIAGHFHRGELHWLGHVPLYVASSIAGYYGREASYRIYEYSDGKIGYRTRYQ